MDKILIVTGGSKGIGEGIIEAYLSEGFKVFSIARSTNALLTSKGVSQFSFDLASTYEIENVIEQIFSLVKFDRVSKITLINNAGTLGKIGPVEKLNVGDIESAFKVNAIVPFILSAAFIKQTAGFTAKKTIINITSGAAGKPYYGWSTYCSTKAALNMLTQSLAVEQAEVSNSVKVLAIAPGVVDTAMQAQIRSSSKADFKDLDRFVSLKNEGALYDAKTVGKQVLSMDLDDAIASGSIMRVTI